MTKNKDKRLQILNGSVVSKRGSTTIVAVERLVKHAKYGKYLQHRKTYKAEDVKESREVGDKVSIVSCPPFSKDKRFKVI